MKKNMVAVILMFLMLVSVIGVASAGEGWGNDIGVRIEKYTNGVDADTPTGPMIPVGDPVYWTYEVTNIGPIGLVNLSVTDDQGVAVSCPTTSLAPGDSMICTANGVAVAGQYANVGTVYGERENLTQYSVTASDPSHYYGEEPPPPPPPAGEGCTPGYWKQPHHLDSWVGYAPDDDYSAVFGVPYNKTLLGALKQGGGGEKALGRHAVAALLNTASSVNYPYSAAEVISMVQSAYATGDFEGIKNMLAEGNELGCPLN